MRRGLAFTAITLLFVGCSDEPAPGPVDGGVRADAEAPDAAPAPEDAGTAPDADAGPTPEDAGSEDAGADVFTITVTLDGVPTAGVRVVQGGAFDRSWTTGADGTVVVEVDRAVVGDLFVMASHPEARISGVDPELDPRPLTIALLRYDRSDNPEYVFNDPGVPGDREDTSKCGHCHRSTNDQWVTSAHAQAAKNPTVHDLYAGVASGIRAEADCLAAGGRWLEGLAPGALGPAFKCYLGDGYLPSHNPECADAPCDAVATSLGNCADCHAPGIDGQVGGRGLLEAAGVAFERGVHCDVCHHVESVDLAAAPGVAGRLSIMRPSEIGPPGLGSGGWRPLTFGPSHDVPNPRMGSVQRDHFREAAFCGGCHELDQDHFPPGLQPDPSRWPSGAIPVQSTYSEWLDSGLVGTAACQECHMPPDPEAGNHGDIQIYEMPQPGIIGGWYRPAGSMRKHTWAGPRLPDSGLLEMAAALDVRKTVRDGEVLAEVTVQNVGGGHAIPTGEPLRNILLEVEALCAGAPQAPVGGTVVPDYGGYRAMKAAGEDWSVWGEAQVGDRVRVIARQRGFHDYVGFGPFGDGTFGPGEKGLPLEVFAGEVEVIAVDRGAVTFDAPLPAGQVAYLVRGPDDWAGRPGFGFARVTAAEDGRRMVAHFVATDVVSDNRLMPLSSYTTTHRFTAGCADPEVVARLVYRRFPVREARLRGWSVPSPVMVEARR